MSRHLHLEYKFTNRGGCDVYEIYSSEDNKKLDHPLGSLTLSPPDGVIIPAASALLWNIPIADNEEPEQLELELAACRLCDGSGRVQIKPLEKHRSIYFIDCPYCEKESSHGAE